MEKFLKSKQLYMLMVLPFVLVALIFVGYVYRGEPAVVPSDTVWGLSLFRHLGTWAKIGVGTVSLLTIFGLLMLINERFRFLQQRTTLPLSLYLLLVTGLLFRVHFGDVLIAVVLLAFALDRLQLAISQLNSNSVVFDFGAVVMVMVLVYPKFLLLLLWALGAIIFSGRSTLKDVTALLLGFLCPLFFLLFAYYVWTDSWNQLPELLLQHLSIGEYSYSFSILEWSRLGILLFVLLLALLHFFTRFSVLTLVHRRFSFALVSLIFFLGLSILVFPFKDLSFVYVFALPLSLFYTQFILDQRSTLIGDGVFCLLLITALLSCWG